MINQPKPDATPFAPDWVSPPGDTILDLIEERDWSQVQLAQRLGFSTKHVNQLIKGAVSLTEDAAVRLSSVLGASVGFWLTREAQYRERVALLGSVQRNKPMIPWLDEFPIREMMAAGLIEKRRINDFIKPTLVTELLQFFGVASPDEWNRNYGNMAFQFRRSRPEQSDTKAISIWLRQGEQLVERDGAGPRFDESKFTRALDEIRKLTVLPRIQFQQRLTKALSDSGVSLVFVPVMPRACVSGVARWLTPHRALIQMSLYGKQNDKFWFTFFHEAAHILLHSSEKKAVFLDDPSKSDSGSKEENEANEWAKSFLIPVKFNPSLRLLKTRAKVQDFARQIGIHPGIVVGRLQHDGIIPVNWLNDLKESYS